MNSNVLRIYDPAECDEHGVPLDWERCRACGGTKRAPAKPGMYDRAISIDTCRTCDGHGSLKAAALAKLRVAQWDRTTDPNARLEDHAIRCEDCGHPMSEGTWERIVPSDHPWAEPKTADARIALAELRRGAEPHPPFVHYSPCDEGCRHGGPMQANWAGVWDEWEPEGAQKTCDAIYRASWRPVDIRTLGWPHDLRPENLVVLCLRCYADRTRLTAATTP